MVSADSRPALRSATDLRYLLRRLVQLINVSGKRSPGFLAMDDSDPDGHGAWFQNNHV
jgi:hypothetical protein